MINFLTNGQGWPSEFTRGRQMAEFLGSTVDSIKDIAGNTVICVKCILDEALAKTAKACYIDFIDDTNTAELCKRVPYASVIVLTEAMKSYLQERVPNRIVVIPEHTCNFENQVRVRNNVTTVGYVGSRQCFALDREELTLALNKAGFDFKFLVCEDKTVTRNDICDFYMSIDIQVAFRPEVTDVRPPVFRNPLKLINAGSFGIPTVAFPEFAYRTVAKTCYIDAIDIADIVESCKRLRDDSNVYQFYSDRAYQMSQNFTIEKIAELYKELDK